MCERRLLGNQGTVLYLLRLFILNAFIFGMLSYLATQLYEEVSSADVALCCDSY